MYKAVIFDIDGTLTDEISWISLSRDLGASVSAHEVIFRNYLDGKIDYPTSREQLIGLWRATGNATRPFITGIFESMPLRAGAIPLVEQLKRNGVELALITGSVDVCAAAVGRRLGIEHYFANTKLIFDGQDELISYDYVPNQAAEKREQLNIFLSAQRLDASECIVIGDSDNDLELFRATGRGILVGDTDNIEMVAAAWRRVLKLDEIIPLL